MSRASFSTDIFFTIGALLAGLACSGRGFTGDGGASGNDDDLTGGSTNGGAGVTGGTATGGSSKGGMASAGAPVGASSGGGSPPGGAPGSSGGGGRGGAPTGGGSGSNECANAPSCAVCCDERYPDGHGNVAGTFYSCGCGMPCYTYCMAEFCGTVYYWSNDCLVCMLGAPESNAECVTADAACNDSELCSGYRSCMLGCL